MQDCYGIISIGAVLFDDVFGPVRCVCRSFMLPAGSGRRFLCAGKGSGGARALYWRSSMEEMNEGRYTEAARRTLIHIPIMHTEVDMGDLSEAVQRATVQRIGVKAWRHKRRAIDDMWTGIEKVVEELELDFDKVRIYQDGLPVCGKEPEIVAQLAGKGSRNHVLLQRLIAKGGAIMGTESRELLLEEYQNVLRALPPRKGRPIPRPNLARAGLNEPLLRRRDRFVAGRINSTLQAGETGILFIGMLHSVENFLDADIRVIRPALHPSGSGGLGENV